MSFQKVMSETLEDIHGVGEVYQHQETKASVVFLKNDDNHRGFAIAFRTPSQNNKGIAHILEHSVLCGSLKFPLKDPFVQLMKGSLSTYLNAMTFPQFTLYPISSPNYKDFSILRDVYLDAVFAPNICRNKAIFQQEGWHYQQEDEVFHFNGVVYNEMKGRASQEDFILENAVSRALFPDSDVRFVSGGLPEAIVDLSYEELLDFYHRYYHPSNAIFFYYGDVSVEEELALIEKEYLSKHTLAQPVGFSSQPTFSELVQIEDCYPLQNENERDRSEILSLSYVCDDVSYEQQLLLMVLCQISLNNDGSFLRKRLLKEGIGESYDMTLDTVLYQPVLSFTAYRCRKQDISRFQEVIEEELQKVVLEGFDQEMIASVLHELEYQFLVDDRDANKAVNSIMQVVERFVFGRKEVFASLKASTYLSSLRNQCENGALQQLVEKYLLNNKHGSYVILHGDSECLLKAEECLRQKELCRNQKFTAREIELLKQEALLLNQYREQEDSAASLALLPCLQREDLEEKEEKEIIEIDTLAEKECYYHDLDTHGIAYLTLYFDLHSFSLEELSTISLLCRILTLVDTEKYSYEQLTKNLALKTGGMVSSVHSLEQKEDVGVYARIRLRYLPYEEEDAFHYLEEILLHTLWKDEKRIQELINELKVNFEASLSFRSDRYALQYASRSFSKVALVEDALSGRTFYHFLKNISPVDSMNHLRQLMKKIFVLNKMTISFVGERQLYVRAKSRMENMLPKGEAHPPVVYHVVKSEEAVGLSQASHVFYCALAAKGPRPSISQLAHLLVLAQILNTNYLWQNIRVLGGAYGASFVVTASGHIGFTSYRDPHLVETEEIYRKVVSFVRNFSVNEREMRQYVIGTLAPLYTPRSNPHQADIWTRRHMSAMTLEENMTLRKEIIATEAKDIRCLSDYLESAFQETVFTAIGDESALLASNRMVKVEEY